MHRSLTLLKVQAANSLKAALRYQFQANIFKEKKKMHSVFKISVPDKPWWGIGLPNGLPPVSPHSVEPPPETGLE